MSTTSTTQIPVREATQAEVEAKGDEYDWGAQHKTRFHDMQRWERVNAILQFEAIMQDEQARDFVEANFVMSHVISDEHEFIAPIVRRTNPDFLVLPPFSMEQKASVRQAIAFAGVDDVDRTYAAVMAALGQPQELILMARSLAPDQSEAKRRLDS